MEKKKIALLAGVGGAVVIGAGVGLALYWRSALVLSPEKVLSQMVKNIGTITSYEDAVHITANVPGGEVPFSEDLGTPDTKTASTTVSSTPVQTTHFSVVLNGKNDIGNKQEIKSQTTLQMRVTPPSMSEVVVGAELRIVNKIVYAQLTDAPVIGFFSLKPFEKQWVKIDPEAVAKQLGDPALETKVLALQKRPEISREQKEQLEQALWQGKVAAITAQMPADKINGLNTYHYGFTVFADKIPAFMKQAVAIVPELQDPRVDPQMLEEQFGVWQNIQGEIWIGKKDFLPYKVLLHLSSKPTAKEPQIMKATIEVNLNKFNAPVQVEVPNKVQKIEDMIQNILGGAMFGTQPDGSMSMPEDMLQADK